MMCDLNCKNLKCIATGECIDNQSLREPMLADADTHEMMAKDIRAKAMEMDEPSLPFIEDAPNLSGYGEYTPITVRASSAPARRTIIAFTGLAGSGKSTAALHLEKNHGFARVRFAGPLKAMLAALGCTHEEIDGSHKEFPCNLLGGKTPRHAMQTLGTEWGRELIANDLWIRAWKAAVDRLPAGVPVVVDDCRFPNEAEVVKAAGGLIIHVNRPGAGAGAAGHISEQHVLRSDYTIDNVFAIEEFTAQVSRLARDLSWADLRYST